MSQLRENRQRLECQRGACRLKTHSLLPIWYAAKSVVSEAVGDAYHSNVHFTIKGSKKSVNDFYKRYNSSTDFSGKKIFPAAKVVRCRQCFFIGCW